MTEVAAEPTVKFNRMTTPELLARAAQERKEINQLYWDFVWDDSGKPVYAFEVDDIATAYRYSTGSSMRSDVDLSAHIAGLVCPDCGELHVVKTRAQLREYLDRNPRCGACELRAIQTAIGRRVSSAEQKPKEKPVPNVSTVMSGEAAIHTIRGGTEIELRLPPLPDGGEYPPMMKLLAALVLRADEEFGWWEDQVRWYDAYMREKRFSKTRMQLRLVSDNDKAPRK